MPADPEEVAEAEAEGVVFKFLVSPIRIKGSGGKATELELQVMAQGEADGAGRRKPVPVEGQIETIPAGTVVAAIRILKPGVSYPEASFGRVVVKESYRGKKLSSIMIQKGLELMETKWNVKQVRISAQAYLQKYYATFGFEVQSEIYIEDQLPHIEMAKLH